MANPHPNTSGLRPAQAGEPSRNPSGRPRREAAHAAALVLGGERAKELTKKMARTVLDEWERLIIMCTYSELESLAHWEDCPVYPRNLALAALKDMELKRTGVLDRLVERQFGKGSPTITSKLKTPKSIAGVVQHLKQEIIVVLQSDNRYSDSLLYEIEALATSLTTMRRAREELQLTPYLIEEVTTQGRLLKVNPLIKLQQDAAEDVMQHCKILGMTYEDLPGVEEASELIELERRILAAANNCDG